MDKDKVKTEDPSKENKELLNTIQKEVGNHKKEFDESLFSVLKRNGSIVPFRSDRINRAIEAAFRDTKKVTVPAPISDEMQKTIDNLTHLVVSQSLKLANKGVSLTVEGIQDMVEITLMKKGFHDVARDYIIYRDKHKASRLDSPQNMKVSRGDGLAHARFNPMKISQTIEAAFRTEKDATTPELIEIVNLLTEKVVAQSVLHVKEEKELDLTQIGNFIEEELMRSSHFSVAKAYIVNRALKESSSTIAPEDQKEETRKRRFNITTKDGQSKVLTEAHLHKRINHACRGYEDTVSVEELLDATLINFYDGIKEEEIDSATIMAARTKIEVDPSYAYVASRILLDKLYRETMGVNSFDKALAKEHGKYFKKYIKHGVHLDRLSPELLEFDLDKIANHMDLERDNLFTYLGLQTLYDRYFIHEEGRRLETPQIFWMRVAMGLSLREEDKTEKALEFYNVLSEFYYVSATPTLFNSGTTHSQLSSCFLSTVLDDLSHIFKVISDDAQLSKWSGGLGNDWTNVRATGAVIKGTNGNSQGIIPFLKVANDTAVAVNQGGKRKGALCSYLETWHYDIEDFLELRKNTGDDRRRTHDMNTANWIPDLFMKRVQEEGKWTLFNPSDVPDLHDLYGLAFEKRYNEYEQMTRDGQIKLFKTIDAVDLWRKMLSMLFETGHPWITFKDPSNIRSPQDHVGVVHSSNLCTEILLNTSKEEVAVCNLGSVNLPKHVTKDGIDQKRLEKTIKTALRMLDNVIDINFYPIAETKNANQKHRPIGLGLMGFQDSLYKLGISYASPEAVEFADRSMEMISYYAILSSSELAKERGTYQTYKGSKWDRGYLPIDTLDILEKERGGYLDVDRKAQMDWEIVRKSVKEHGVRNSNIMAIAPTATIANIAGVSASIEPAYKHLYVKSNLSGEFTIPNIYLIEKLQELGIWDAEMLDDLKYYDGEISEIERIPDEIKKIYLTAFQIDPEWLIECGAKRQKWIDMGQSLNLYLSEPSGKKMHEMYTLAWKKGVKTTYYLRTLGATQIEKSTTDINKRGLQPRWMKNESPSSRVTVDRDIPEKPIVCNLDEGCESCQ